ncbi:MAG: hypothetical protein U1E51_14190 [Candidatus Binatia bacterium]|nr:hypothetical protein [Candidatus Binatia bacterium]
MAVTFQAVGAMTGGAGVTSLTVTAPASAADDILVAQIASPAGHTVSPPDGTWTEFVSSLNGALRSYLFWKRATGSGGNFVFPASGATNLYGVISAWRGAITSATPIDATAPSVSNNASSDIVTYAAFNPTETDAFVVACGFYNDNLTTAGVISGTNPTFALRWNLESAVAFDFSMFGYSGSSDGADTGARSHSTTSVVDVINVGVLFGLVAVGGGAPPASGLILPWLVAQGNDVVMAGSI